MTPKKLFRAFVFLLMLFVVLYVGMNNTDAIKFQFPLLLDKPVTQPAALLFFAMFAVGIIGGLALHGDSDSKGGEAGGSAKKKK